MRVLITGGGTGGHLYPALAIAKGLLKERPDTEVLFVGTEKGLEAEKVPQEGFELKTITVVGLPRRPSIAFFKSSFLAAKGCIESRRILKEFKPHVVVGTGGYVCGPVLLMAAMSKIPCIIQEQNTIPGLTNRILSRFVRKIAVAFDEAVKFFPDPKRVIVTGNPVRPEIASISKEEGTKAFNLNPRKTVLLVFGGGQGARSINNALLEAIPNLLKVKELQILHSTGKDNFESFYGEVIKIQGVKEGLKRRQLIIEPYIDKMPHAYAASDLVLSRAGAMSLSEITARGLPAILVPFPYAANNHQEHNARVLQNKGAAVIIHDDQLNGEVLTQIVVDIVSDKDRLKKMTQNSKELGKIHATQELVQLVIDTFEKP